MTDFNPIKLKITDDMLDQAQRRNKGAYNSNSFMAGAGNVVGFLGEYMVQSIRSDFEFKDDFNYDFISKGRKVDIKTKKQNVPTDPLGMYEASIADESLHQKVDYYVFCRVYWDNIKKTYPFGWILGVISKEKYFKNARRLKKGEKDGSNGYIVKNNCWNISYDKLDKLEEE